MRQKLKYLMVLSLLATLPVMADQPITTDLPLPVEAAKTTTLELRQLDALIAMTQKSLEEQRSLRALIAQYQEMQQLYLQRTGDRELLLQVAKMAQRIQECVDRYHLTHTFNSEFLSELALFAQVAAKRGIPKP